MSLQELQESLREKVRGAAAENFNVTLEQIAAEVPPRTEMGATLALNRSGWGRARPGRTNFGWQGSTVDSDVGLPHPGVDACNTHITSTGPRRDAKPGR